MNKTLANISSYIFHPLLAPTFTFVILLFVFPSTVISYNWDLQNKLTLTFAIFLLTYMIPGAATYLLARSNHVTHVELSNQKERTLPLFLTITTYSITTIFCYSKIPHHPSFYYIMGINTLLIAVIFFVNFFWKISAHAAGIGGVLCYFFIFSRHAESEQTILFSIIFLIAGLVLGARIALKAHSPAQTYVGFLIGILVTSAILLFI